MADNPWAFGWDQIIAIAEVLVIAGAAGAAYVASVQFRREKIEVRQAEVAEEALAIAYHAVDVFKTIRNPFSEIPVDKAGDRTYVFKKKLNQIDEFSEFWQKVIDIRPKLKAIFGGSADDLMIEIMKIRNEVGYAARELAYERDHMDRDWIKEQEKVVFGRAGDKIAKELEAVVDGFEKKFSPILASKYRK